jgi:hypothetical protein
MTSYWSQCSVRGLLALCLLGGAVASALAASPEQVAAECTRQMSLGICMTKVERSSITPGQTMLLSGVGRVSYAAYLDYVDLNNPKLPTDPAMCQLALRHMTQSPGSDHDKIARALWTPVFTTHPAAASQPTESYTQRFMKIFLSWFEYVKRQWGR